MVGGQGNPPMAIDEAIILLDTIITRLKISPPSKPAAQKGAVTVTPWPPQSVKLLKQVEVPEPKLSLKSAKLTAEQQEAEKGSILDRPGKKPLKLPGAPPAEKPAKAPNAAAKGSSEKESEPVENFEKAHVQVGLVHSVSDHPISEKLFICKVEFAPGQFRQVVAGLKKFYTAAELEQRKVALILNLKPAKLAGQLSEAMILAGDSHADGVETVKVLELPSEASVGDRVYLEGSTPSASPAKQLSSKIWEKVVPLLKVEGGVATFDKIPLVSSAGVVRIPLPDGAGIH